MTDHAFFDVEALLGELRRRADEAREADPTFDVDYGLQPAPSVGLPPDLGSPHGAIHASWVEGQGESGYAQERLAVFWLDDGRLVRLLLEDERKDRSILEAGAATFSPGSDDLREQLMSFLLEMLPRGPGKGEARS